MVPFERYFRVDGAIAIIWKGKERGERVTCKNTKSAMFLPSGCGPNPFSLTHCPTTLTRSIPSLSRALCILSDCVWFPEEMLGDK